MPVSKLRPSGLVGAGRALYGRHWLITSARPAAMPRCGPQNLYGEQMSMSAPMARTSIGSCAA